MRRGGSLAGADEGNRVEFSARARQKTGWITPGGKIVRIARIQQNAATDRGQRRVIVQCGHGAGERCGVSEFRVVVQAEDDAAMTERRTAIAPAGDTVVAVQRQQRRILTSSDIGGEPREVLRL